MIQPVTISDYIERCYLQGWHKDSDSCGDGMMNDEERFAAV